MIINDIFSFDEQNYSSLSFRDKLNILGEMQQILAEEIQRLSKRGGMIKKLDL